MKYELITCTVGENPADVSYSRRFLPKQWSEAHGDPPIQSGTYYYLCFEGMEIGNAYAWSGPYESIDAGLADRQAEIDQSN